MKREYHKWFSPALGREMELLVFGHAGAPTLVFPTSCGRFFDFEDHGMIEAVQEKLKQGHLQLFCVDSVDSESWYNRYAGARRRILRHLQYETYLLEEVLHFIHLQNGAPGLSALGCSFGGYHAVNIALRHPEIFTSFLSLGGMFDPASLLSGYYDQNVYFHAPLHYLPNLTDPWFVNRFRHNSYVLATGIHDHCREQNEKLARLMRDKAVPVRLDVWGDNTGHDWPWWQKMMQTYL
jgi:esterase/lipase superfamily enzyme